MRIAVICGSIRSSLGDMRRAELDLTRGGWGVFFPVPIPVEDHDPFADAMHLTRIACLPSNEERAVVIVPKKDGSIGISTERELWFARLWWGPDVVGWYTDHLNPEVAERSQERYGFGQEPGDLMATLISALMERRSNAN